MPATSWTPDAAFWCDRPVAITGANGFLGSHLTGLLADLGASIVVLERDDVRPSSVVDQWRARVSVVEGDVTDQPLLERLLGEYEVRTVFHLAAQTQVVVANDNPVSTFDSNIRGTWSLLEAVRRSPRVQHVISASSDKAYGTQPRLPYDEEMPLRPVNPYDVSKASADLLAQSYHQTFGTPVSITRCGNFFGPGDRNWDRIVPGTIRSLLRGERPVIRSDGSLVRDYLYVVDGALAYVCLAEAMAAQPTTIGEAFNFSTERPLSVLDVVALLQKTVGTDLDPEILGVARAEIDAQHLSSRKAREQLKWAPRYSLEDALDETVAWYRNELS
jgi:CDP-glucose 4,6-dehydratase